MKFCASRYTNSQKMTHLGRFGELDDSNFASRRMRTFDVYRRVQYIF